MNKNTIQIIEYEKLYLKKIESYDRVVDKEIFESLENFILENDTPFLILKSYKKRKYIQAQNYVGVIQLKNGFTLEILPKITNLEKNTEESRKILIKMIKTLKNPPFKNINKADLKNSKMPLFEIFIKMFLDELALLLKLGIKSSYLQKQDNLKFLKGKLLIKEQIKKNYIHKERFFTEFDKFSINRIENRLIKTTLMFLLKKSSSNDNKKLIKRYLMFFDSVSISHNIRNDFNKLKLTRDMLHYKTIISWAEIFLLNESFSIYKGQNIAFALLFDMNLLFEAYVGNFFRKNCIKPRQYKIKLQDSKYHLAYNGNNKYFALKPDIVIENDDNHEIIILDTKWKILSSIGNKTISQSDMYQLYAYGTKYENCNELYLIYPVTKEKIQQKQYILLRKKENKELTLKILFFDLKKDIVCTDVTSDSEFDYNICTKRL